MRESVIEKDVCKEARALGMSVHKWVSVNEKGLPDRIFIIPGPIAHWFCIEFKTPSGVISPSQRRKIAHLQSIGVHVYICDSFSEGVEILKSQKMQHNARIRVLDAFARGKRC